MEQTKGPVRTGDPWTSHAAAEDVAPSIDTVRTRVLSILTAHDGLTHDALIALYRESGWPPASDSSIRTRCSELLRDGRVERVNGQTGQSRFGRPALLWRATPDPT